MCQPQVDNFDQCARLGIDEGHCFAFNNGTLPVCQPVCDPLRSACDAGKGCFFAVDHYMCELSQRQFGDLRPECTNESDCLPGLACAPSALLADCEGANGEVPFGCCLNYCDRLLGDKACGDNLHCIDLPGEWPGIENVGVCGNPR
jgi:hypothetical protein